MKSANNNSKKTKRGTTITYTQKMLGLGKEIWEDLDPLEYICKERTSWDKKYTRRYCYRHFTFS